MINKIKNIANTEDKKRLASNFFSLSVLQVFSYILPLLTLPYLVRILGVEKFGLVAFAASFIMFFNILVDYGFNLSATREVAVNRENKSKITEIYSSVMSIKIVLILFSFLILASIVYSFDKFRVDDTLYFITFIVVIGQAFFPIWYFQGMEKMKYITIVNISSKTLFTIAIFVFVHSEADYLLVPLLTGLGSIIGSIYALYIVKKNFNQEFRFQSFSTLKKYFIDSTLYFYSSLSASAYTSFNAFVLGLFTNNTMVGYYTLAEKLYMAIKSLYSPIIQVMYPYISKKRNIEFYKKIFFIVVILNILGITILFFLDIYLFKLLFGDNFTYSSIEIFNVFLFTMFFVAPSMMIGHPLLGALGYVKDANYSVVLASIFYIIGVAILIIFDSVNIYSIAFMVFLPEFIVFLYRFIKVRKYKIWELK